MHACPYALTATPALQAGTSAATSAGIAGAEDLVEREAKRLEVMKRRQERELAQLIGFEMARKEMQDKAEAKVGWEGGRTGQAGLVVWYFPCKRRWGPPVLRGVVVSWPLACKVKGLMPVWLTFFGNLTLHKAAQLLFPHSHTPSILALFEQVREQERRAEEQRCAKQAADEEWRRAQHKREIQRKLEEEAREREVKASKQQGGRQSLLNIWGRGRRARKLGGLWLLGWACVDGRHGNVGTDSVHLLWWSVPCI